MSFQPSSLCDAAKMTQGQPHILDEYAFENESEPVVYMVLEWLHATYEKNKRWTLRMPLYD